LRIETVHLLYSWRHVVLPKRLKFEITICIIWCQFPALCACGLICAKCCSAFRNISDLYFVPLSYQRRSQDFWSGGAAKPRWGQAAMQCLETPRASIHPKKGGGGLVLQIRKVRWYATRKFFYFWYTEMAFPAIWRHL
jgi:hypothetical protein